MCSRVLLRQCTAIQKLNEPIGLRTAENGIVATFDNLHKGVGMPIAWFLLIDTIAGSLIFLSISGVELWVKLSSVQS